MSGTIDLQLNGFGGVDFNDAAMNLEQLRSACEKVRADGVDGFLATIITDDLDKMEAKLRNVASLRTQDRLIQETIWGIHIEGPFISPVKGFVGAHPVQSVVPASVDAMQRLLDASGGLTKIVTLAPECDPDFATTRFLTNQKIVVSAGHTDASLDALQGSIDAGLSMFTHLGHGCPIQMHRHDNILQRVMHCANDLWVSFIADGAHLPFYVLKNFLDYFDVERCVIVSDAISAAGMGTGTFTLGNQSIVIDEDLVPRAPDRSHFVGSACPMSRMAANLREHLAYDETIIDALMRKNPKKILELPTSSIR